MSPQVGKITQQDLFDLITYDPLSGVVLWKKAVGTSSPGKRAGTSKGSNGYWRIQIRGNQYLLHRLVWLYMTGSFPSDKIDHKDHNKGNNRWDNLREVSSLLNSQNQKKHSRNTSGYTGVVKAYNNTWVARIMVNGIDHYLGTFKHIEDAIAARQQANIKYGFHENHGK